MTKRLLVLPTGIKARITRGTCTSIAALALALALPPAASATDLSDIYLLAKDYDPTLQAAMATHAAALQQLPLARSAFRPQVNLGFDASVGEQDDDGDGLFQSTRWTLSISQSIYHRSNSALLGQAKLGVLQADANLEAARQQLILRVAEAYFEVLRAEAAVAFSQAELQAIDRQKDQAEKRFDVGLATVVDVRDAQAQFDLAVAQEVAAGNGLETALEALRLLSGSDSEKLAALKDSIPLVAPEPARIKDWVQIAVDQNLDLATARLATESADVKVAAERGARHPTLDLLAIASSSNTDQERRQDQHIESGELRLELRVPLYTGGRINAQVSSARSEAEASKLRLRAQELATEQRTRDAYRGVVTNISRVLALNEALTSTQKSAEATDAGFRAGTRTSVDVLRALRDTFRARSDYVNARYDYVLNTLSLKSAAGTLGEQDLMAVNALLEERE